MRISAVADFLSVIWEDPGRAGPSMRISAVVDFLAVLWEEMRTMGDGGVHPRLFIILVTYHLP